MMHDVKGHYNWVSEVIKITRENNISNTEMSNLDVSTKLRKKITGLIYWIVLNLTKGKKLRTSALVKHVIKFEPYLNIVKNYKCRRMLSKFRLSSHDLEIGRRGMIKNQLSRKEDTVL